MAIILGVAYIDPPHVIVVSCVVFFRKFQKMKSSKEGYRTINEVELFEGNLPTAMPQR